MTIKISKSKYLSAKTIAAFGAQAKKEWRELRGQRQWFYLSTKRLWTLYKDNEPVCVIGLKQNSIIGTGAELYFLLCRSFNKHLRSCLQFLKRGVRRLARIYGYIIMRVEEGFWVGEKFAKFIGFHPHGVYTTIDNAKFTFFVMRAS